MFRLVALLALLGAMIFGGAARAQEEPGALGAEPLNAGWERTLDRIDAYAKGAEHTTEQHEAFNAELETIKGEAADVSALAQDRIDDYARLLDALGPAPAEGEPPEPVDIQLKRDDLTSQLNSFRSRRAQAELTIARAHEVEAALSDAVRQEFRERMLSRGALPLDPDTIALAVPEFLEVLGILAQSYSQWRAGLSDEEIVSMRWRGVFVLAAFVVAWSIRRFLLKRYGRDARIENPSYPRRFVAAVAEGCARGIVPASLFAAPLVMIPLGLALARGLFAHVIIALCEALIILFLGIALTRATLAPDLPAWRLTRLDPRAAHVLSRRIIFLIAVFAADVFFDRAVCLDCEIRHIPVSAELESLYSLIIDALEAVGILLVVQGWLWRSAPETASASRERATTVSVEPDDGPAEQPIGGRVWSIMRRIIGAVAVIGVGANLIGYVNLGDRLIDGLMLSGAILAALFLIRRLLRELMRFGLASSLIGQRLGLTENSRDQVCFWLGVVLDVVLILVACYAILPIWGLPRTDLSRGIGDVLAGFSVGGVTISFMDILTALLIFFIAVAATRLVRQTLAEKVLVRTRMDPGVRNSLTSLVSYVGITIAALLAVGVMGFNFQNIAIIAGALSVGIGFGLQNIVNNFVSGLILLVERPIKIGDWVVVGENQGYVKKISVRATEIETFDRASVILPNSELLSSAVTNWTHKDKLGRLIVMVGVAYGSDTERVREILLACAKDHQEILNWPQPFVLFQDFGGSSLDFELRAYLREVDKRLSVGSELRFAIDKAFREEGIEIPFAQHDIHLRDIERLEQALAALKPDRRTVPEDAAPPPGPAGEKPA